MPFIVVLCVSTAHTPHVPHTGSAARLRRTNVVRLGLRVVVPSVFHATPSLAVPRRALRTCHGGMALFWFLDRISVLAFPLALLTCGWFGVSGASEASVYPEDPSTCKAVDEDLHPSASAPVFIQWDHIPSDFVTVRSPPRMMHKGVAWLCSCFVFAS